MYNSLKHLFCMRRRLCCKLKAKLYSIDYKRDVNDFRWLCRSCHMKEDGRLKTFNKKRNYLIKKGIVKRDKYGKFN